MCAIELTTGEFFGHFGTEEPRVSVRLQPTPGCHGLSSFNFTVKGSDSSAYTSQVVVLVAP